MESCWVQGSLSVLFLGPEGVRIGITWGGGGALYQAASGAMPILCFPSSLPCLSYWLFWELLATT